MEPVLPETEPAQENNPVINQGKISIAARLIPCLSYASLAFGVGLSSVIILYYLFSVSPSDLTASTPALRLLANGGMPAMVLIYVAAAFGMFGVFLLFARLMVDTDKETPVAGFYVPPAVLSLLAGACYWLALSYLIDIIIPGKLPLDADPGSYMSIAFLLFGATILFAAVALIVVFYSLVKNTRKFSGRSFAPLIAIFIIQCFMLYLMFGNQYRTWWLLSAAY